MPRLKPDTLAARKTHILKAALVCFAEKGYHQTTMDDIVQAAGLSKGGLYVHFSSKKELFIALFDWFIDEFGVFVAPAIPGMTSYDRLAAFVADMMANTASDEFWTVSALMTDVWAENSRDPDVNVLVKNLYASVRGSLVQIIEDGIAESVFKPVDATAAASMLIAMFEGLMIQAVADEIVIDWMAVSTLLNAMIASLLVEQE
ncbi:TetR/AcrR family transcriptional regulator [Chloroflexota bacterium]